MSSLTADLEEAARFGVEADGGISRFAWTPELAEVNDWFIRRLEELDLAAWIEFLAMAANEFGLVIERIALAGRARHEELNDALGFWSADSLSAFQ